MKPRLAAFPKCYMDELCVHRSMTVFEWIELAATLGASKNNEDRYKAQPTVPRTGLNIRPKYISYRHGYIETWH
jgi:hypothetical protein